MSLLPRILLVDESADDRDLIGLVLAGAFGEVAIEAVADAAALARAVSAGQFGLVLAEHDPSWIRSSDLLRLLHDLCPDCPVIVVTGKPLEQVAAEVLHLAADGLVPKTSSGLAGLPQAVRSALFRARRRRAESPADRPFRRLFDALPVALFIASEDGTLLDVNPAFAGLLGLSTPEQCAQRPFASLFAEAAEAEAFAARLAAAGGPLAAEARLRRADDRSFWGSLTAWRAAGESGQPGRIQGVIEDLSARRAAEEELARRGEALAGSNAELEEMAYAVSHDLRKPLTQIARYLELLDADAGAGLGDDARRLLAQARASAGRLEAMVEAVLRCARIEGAAAPLAEVALDPVLDRVLERLAEELAASGAEVVRRPLPTVRADGAQVEQLLWNLLDNALKFRGPAAPRIELAAEDGGDHWHLTVRDNGIGIEARDSARVFAVFQRLHTAAEIPGSGIGLAVCRRIVARHGGRIWVESQPGAGSTFHFTLAKRPAPRSPSPPEDPGE
ncbi:MAG: PAS domain S-box protein [Thermoanaerobaculia bacterium]|nr:PAS domain S-box protein [Thermoanaerobaculia bacterium]MCZ7652300.1 ATP-binding protein [Thermoanaerobaculia bacterium]